MQQLQITKAKPNPLGKDKYGSLSPNSQLVGEWIDIKNITSISLDMSGVKVYDHTFSNVCGDQGRREIFCFSHFVLMPGKVVRIHSGNEVPLSQLSLVDSLGADIHAYTGYKYAWNNVCGDVAELLTSGGVQLDKTSYGARPVEGKVLRRIGYVLV